MLILFATLFSLLFLLFLLLWISSPGKPKLFLDAKGIVLPNSIAEKSFVTINGMQQGVFIKGRDTTKPVLLYLHGGLPDYFLTQKYPTALEENFIVVWWEQRGSGLSFNKDLLPENITVDQCVSDVIVMTNYLRQRFGRERIYLMGRSGGTFTGIQAAAKAPGLYHAYIGLAQVSNQLKSEQLASDYMLKRYMEKGDNAMVKKLQAAQVSNANGTPKAYLTLRDKAMHALGIGTMRNMHSVFTGIFLPSLFFKEYTVKEKFTLWRAKSRAGVSTLWKYILETDMKKAVPALDVPVYFFHGIYDYTCSYTEAKSYFDQLQAPLKGFYTFNQSAHSPLFEEPEKLLRILREDVLLGTASLADKN